LVVATRNQHGPKPQHPARFPSGANVAIQVSAGKSSLAVALVVLPGDIAELRQAYGAFHPEARALLDACTEVMKSALYVRDPLPRWSDACSLSGHPSVDVSQTRRLKFEIPGVCLSQ
jgi:hypothetical protein